MRFLCLCVTQSQKWKKIENEGQTHLVVTYKLLLDDMFFSGWPENCAEVCISKTSYADLMCRSSCDLLVIHSQSTITSRRDRMLVYMILYDKADAERSTNKLIGTQYKNISCCLIITMPIKPRLLYPLVHFRLQPSVSEDHLLFALIQAVTRRGHP